MDLFLLIRSLIQSPCTQMVRRKQLESLRIVAVSCSQGREVVLVLLAESSRTVSGILSDTSIMRFLRMLRGGVLAAIEFESESPELLDHIGKILHDAADRVGTLYQFYSSPAAQRCSAGMYALNWNGSNFTELRQNIL